jgi:hypothetical protein
MHSSLYDYLGSLSLTGIVIVCAIIYGFAVVVLYPMRAHFEGAAYNVARSSNIGDLFLVGVVFIAWHLLHDLGVQPPAWAVHGGWQFICMFLGVIAAFYFTFGQTPLLRSHATDMYHNSVVMGVLVFALLYVAPLILWSGEWRFVTVSLLLVVGWAMLVASDIGTGRLQQRDWLKQHDPAKYALLRQD